MEGEQRLWSRLVRFELDPAREPEHRPTPHRQSPMQRMLLFCRWCARGQGPKGRGPTPQEMWARPGPPGRGHLAKWQGASRGASHAHVVPVIGSVAAPQRPHATLRYIGASNEVLWGPHQTLQGVVWQGEGGLQGAAAALGVGGRWQGRGGANIASDATSTITTGIRAVVQHQAGRDQQAHRERARHRRSRGATAAHLGRKREGQKCAAASKRDRETPHTHYFRLRHFYSAHTYTQAHSALQHDGEGQVGVSQGR
jgi:hypothetical protein